MEVPNLLDSKCFSNVFQRKFRIFHVHLQAMWPLHPPSPPPTNPDTLVPSILGPWQAATSASSSSRGTLGLMSEVPGKNLGQLDHPKNNRQDGSRSLRPRTPFLEATLLRALHHASRIQRKGGTPENPEKIKRLSDLCHEWTTKMQIGYMRCCNWKFL